MRLGQELVRRQSFHVNEAMNIEFSELNTIVTGYKRSIIWQMTSFNVEHSCIWHFDCSYT